MPIESFFKPELKVFFETGKVPKKAKWQSVKKIVLRKLDMLDYAEVLDDLKSPPGNHLEILKGNLAGLYSIRVNDQWRIVFKWSAKGAFDVRVVDYH